MSVRCEVCTKRLGAQEISHGIRYGTTDPSTDLFLPARESAYVILCNQCGEALLKLIYQKLSPSSNPYHKQLFK